MTSTLPEAPPPSLPPAPVQEITIPALNTAGDAGAIDEADEMQRTMARHSGPFLWKGQELKPFTPSREAVFRAHRSQVGAPSLDEALTSPAAFAVDAARLLWFCSHEPQTWTQFLARQPRMVNDEPHNAAAALEAELILPWMDEHLPVEKLVEAYTLCCDILTRRRLTQARPQDSGNGDDSGN